ncbi:hypothetical protein DOTSEDRAFT_71220 [Dothistroma septosporum NZE10]|uniref:DUF7918 domain-containing protein n=1 Tax=Dothistroma septosporum (strain NZE10 / CBS 128990) TaxID=675120 RepID=N1PPS1_DOTSN|nr:hypothetical protein DOTSEDRAFT_71220 [Dothistroma septosporum NZE10]
MKHYLHPGVQVSLRVGGVDLAEYNIDDEEDEEVNTVTKYVEAVSGANFTVNFNAKVDCAPDPRDSCQMSVHLDGKYVTNIVFKMRDTTALARGTFEQLCEGHRSTAAAGGYNLEKFAFAALQTNDGPVKAEKIKELKKLGELSVRCTWARDAGTSHRLDHTPYKSAFTNGVSEKSLKGRAISQHATLAPPERRNGVFRLIELEYPYGNVPFAVFAFRYRTRKDLQIESVIPRSPSPTSLEERDPDDLSPEEMRELLRRMREREAYTVRVKREGEKCERRARSTTGIDRGDDDDDDFEITTGPAKRRHTSNDSGVEVVDLTED